MNRAIAQVLMLSVLVGLSSKAAWALPAVFTMNVVEINGSGAGLPATDVQVNPGDVVRIEVFLENWAPEELGAYQFAIDLASLASGGGSPLALAEVPCASNADCPLTDLCDQGAGVCECLESIFIDTSRVDFVYFDRQIIAAASCFFVDLLAAGAVRVGPAEPDDGASNYAGTLALSIPNDASEVYTVRFGLGFNSTFAFGGGNAQIPVDATAAITLSVNPPTVPTVSTWGTAVLALLLLTAAKIFHRRRSMTQFRTPFLTGA